MSGIEPFLAKAAVKFTEAAFWKAVAVNTAVAVGTTLISRALTPKPKVGDFDQGRQVGLKRDPNYAREVIVGKAAVGGSLVYHTTSGTDNKYLWRVIALADFPCTSLEAVYFGDEQCTLTGDPSSTYASITSHFLDKDGSAKVSVRFYDGRQTTGDGPLVAAAPVDEWDSNAIGEGCCYVIVKSEYDDYAYAAGDPELKFVVKGAPIYDPRKDSTVDGGAGTHRADDWETWEWSANAGLITAQYLRGFDHDGVVVVGGRGSRAGDVDEGYVIAAANNSDEEIALAAGGTEKRYEIHGVLSSATNPRPQLDDLIAAMDGQFVQSGGPAKIYAGVVKSSVMTITDADVIALDEIRVTPRRDLSERVNSVTGTYIDAYQGYAEQPIEQRSDAAAIANDNGRFERTIQLKYVTSGTQAQRIAQRIINRGRYECNAQLTMGPKALRLEAGDWITYQSDIFGWTKIFEVEKHSVLPDMQCPLALQEVGTDIDDWSADDEAGVTTGAITRNLPAGSLAVSGLDVTGVLIGSTPALFIEWDAPTDPRIRGVTIEYRIKGASLAGTRNATNTMTSLTIFEGVTAAGDYEVRIAPITVNARPVWSSWVEEAAGEDPGGGVSGEDSGTYSGASVENPNWTDVCQVDLTGVTSGAETLSFSGSTVSLEDMFSLSDDDPTTYDWRVIEIPTSGGSAFTHKSGLISGSYSGGMWDITISNVSTLSSAVSPVNTGAVTYKLQIQNNGDGPANLTNFQGNLVVNANIS